MITIGNTKISFKRTMETIEIYVKGHLKPFIVPTTWAVARRFKNGSLIGVKMYPAYCSPNEFFSSGRGQRIALARLLKSLKVKRETRLKVWDAYFALEV